jgi:hypothetical protein
MRILDSLSPAFRKIVDALSPRLKIDGLDISDTSVSFLSVNAKNDFISQHSIKLPHGAIEKGTVKDREKFIEALKKLHDEITIKKSEDIHVVVSISDENVYSQVISIPSISSEAFSDVVKLNLQAINPMDIDNVYYDYQRLNDLNNNETELLASFVSKKIVDDLVDSLSEAGFFAIAIEQKSFSLIRTINIYGNGIESLPYLIIYTNSDGLSFSLVKDSTLHFNKFVSWESVIGNTPNADAAITFKDLSSVILRESHNIINYYTLKYPGELRAVYSVSSELEEYVKNIIEDNLSIKSQPLTIKKYAVKQPWFVVLGCATRGILPRSQDEQISLAPSGTETQFFQSKALAFSIAWRNIFISFMFVILIVFGGTYLFLVSVYKGLGSDVSGLSYIQQDNAKLAEIKEGANSFNQLVGKILNIKQQNVQWSKFVDRIFKEAGSEVKIEKLTVTSPDSPVVIRAVTTSESSAINFKNKIAAIKFISNVEMPISDIKQIDERIIGFTVIFRISNTKFE